VLKATKWHSFRFFLEILRENFMQIFSDYKTRIQTSAAACKTWLFRFIAQKLYVFI